MMDVYRSFKLSHTLKCMWDDIKSSSHLREASESKAESAELLQTQRQQMAWQKVNMASFFNSASTPEAKKQAQTVYILKYCF